jgi:hypothetical protein
MSDATDADDSRPSHESLSSAPPAPAHRGASAKVRLWLVRHGESEANAAGVIAGQQDLVSLIRVLRRPLPVVLRPKQRSPPHVEFLLFSLSAFD